MFEATVSAMVAVAAPPFETAPVKVAVVGLEPQPAEAYGTGVLVVTVLALNEGIARVILSAGDARMLDAVNW